MEKLISNSLISTPDIYYRSAEHVLVFRWRCLLPGDEWLSLSYEALWAFAVRHNCPYWLIDLRRHPTGSAKQLLQSFKEQCARVKKNSPGVGTIYASYLVAPSALGCYANLFSSRLLYANEKGYHAAAFIDEGIANAWLKHRQLG